MDHHFVHRVSRLFPSSFTSCQFRSVPDVVESSISVTKTTKILHDSNGGPEPFSNMYRNPFLIKPQEPKMPKNKNNVLKSFKKTLLLGSDTEGRRCPPVTPISVLASEQRVKPKESTKINNSSSSNSGWFSSDDEEGDVDGESDAFFSLSSCSSESFRLKTANTSRRFDNKSTELGRCSSRISVKSANTILSQCSLETTKTSTKNPLGKHRNLARNHTQFVKESKILTGCEVVESSTDLYYGNCRSTTPHCRKTAKTRQKTGKNRRSRNIIASGSGNDCGSAIVNDRLQESYAEEKSSNDPHGDFRTSMVEMIIEKQIFGAKDLERLLYCFLSLNSPYYHRIIVEVFTEICDTLFSN